ncbi:MAG: outer membrane beta-barrel protein [Bacteroidota bacterium]
MPENYIDRIVRAKLSSLEVSLKSADWEVMLEKLNNSFYQIVKDKLQSLKLPMEEADWYALSTELDQVFDQHIHQYLDTLSVPFESKDWPLFAAKLNGHPLDELISSKLHDFQLPLSSEDWNAFEQELDQDPLITDIRHLLQSFTLPFLSSDWLVLENQMDQNFDEGIEQKLEGFELPLRPDDWSLMSASLDGNSFDESIRESLSKHDIPLFLSDWEELAEQLEAPFDSTIKTKLEQALLTPQAGDWKAMSNMLAGEEDRVPVLWQWRTYATAAAVVLLLLFSGLGIQQSLKSPGSDIPNELALQSSSESVSTSVQQSQTDLAGENDVITPVDHSSDSDTKSDGSHISLVEGSQHTFPASSSTYESPQIQALGANPLIFANNSVPESIIPQKVMSAFVENTDISYNKKHTSRTIDRISHRKLDMNDFAQPLFRERGLDLFDPMLRSSRPEVRLGWYAATVRTKAELNDHADSLGYATGLRIHMKIRNGWHLVTGFLYGKKTFSHVYPISESGFLGSYGKTYGDFTVLEVPLLARYEFPDVHGLTVYGQAGMVMVMNLEETYDNLDPRSPVNASFVTRRLDPDMLASETHTWNLKTQPGNIHVALGLRYAMTSQLSLELEPYFQQSLQRYTGSTSLQDRKKLYNSGIGATLIYTFSSDSKK